MDDKQSTNTEHTGRAILTIRLIRSFEHRNIKNIVIHDVDLSQTVAKLKELVNKAIKESNAPPPFKTFKYDTLKIEMIPFKAKSTDPIINCLDDDKLILPDSKTLAESEIINETEISYFKMEDYESYKKMKASGTTEFL